MADELERVFLVLGRDERERGVAFERTVDVAQLAVDARRERGLGEARPDRRRHVRRSGAGRNFAHGAIGKGDLSAANFLVAEKYIEAVRALATAPNQRVVVVPIEAAALAGTLGGLAEIARGAFGEATPPRRPGQPPNTGTPRA